MQFVAVWRWLAAEWIRSPLTWLAAACMALMGLATASLGPLGIVNDPATAPQLDQLWFVFTYVGAALGLSLLSRTGVIWDELGPAPQASIGTAVLLLVAVFHGLLGVAPVGCLVGPHMLTPLLPDAGAAVLCAAHWSVLAIAAQRTPLPLSGKLLALACAGWWLPALVSDMPAWERMTWALSPARHLESRPVETFMGRMVDTIPVLAWWVAAALLPKRSAFKR